MPAQAITSSQAITYVHDDAGRLEAAINPGTGVAIYHYDPSGNITSIARPAITAVSIIDFQPKRGPVGTAVAIYGTAFSTTPSSDTVKFNGVTATVTSATAAKIVAPVPAGATSGTISVTVGSSTATSAASFAVGTLAPTITGPPPTVVAAASSVSIAGTNFQTTALNDNVEFNASRAQVTAATSTSLTATVPPGATSGGFRVVTPYGSASGGDVYVPPPGFATTDVAATTRLSFGVASGNLSIPANKIAIAIFDASAGQRISLNAPMSISGCCVTVTVYNPDGTVLTTAYMGTGGGFIDVTKVLETGTHAIVVDPDLSYTGTANLTVYNVPPDPTTTITASQNGGTASLTTTTPGQNATFTFAGSTGQRISLGTSMPPPPTPCCYGVTFINPDGTTLQSSSVGVGQGFIDTLTLTQTGTHTILVNPDYTQTGTMTLTLYLVPADASTTLTLPGSGSVTTTTPGQNATATFPGTTGQQVNLTVGIPWCCASVTVTNPSGSILVNGQPIGYGNTIIPLSLPQTGTYTIFINPDSTLTGTITLTLALAGRASTPERSSTSPAGDVTPQPGDTSRPLPGTISEAQLQQYEARGEAWMPGAAQIDGPWLSGRPASVFEHMAPLDASRGKTGLSGEVLRLNGQPLDGVTLRIGNRRTKTDDQGRFLLRSIPAGHDVLVIDGTSANRPGASYGIFEDGVDVASRRTNILPYTIWMPLIDTGNAVSIPSPTTTTVRITTPRIPGLEIVLPPGTVVKDMAGHVVRQLSITPVPVDRPPFPLPDVEVPVYFTVQPGSSYVFPHGARIIYPNYSHVAPGTRVNFWNYDPDSRGWYVYGHGTVTPNGKQIVPDPGVSVYEFTGAMINVAGLFPPGLGPGHGGEDGDIVDSNTGLFVYSKTDLSLPGVMPISIARTYRQLDPNGNYPFGVGMNFPYEVYLNDPGGQYQEANLVLPDGGQIHFDCVLTGSPPACPGAFTATYQANSTPTIFFKSVIAWNGKGWNLTLKNGTVMVFGENAPLQGIRDHNGNWIAVSHANGQKGNITRVASSSGRWVTLTYDPNNHVSEIDDNMGRKVTYTYDPSGRMQTATTYADPVNNPSGEITQYGWDPTTDPANPKFTEIDTVTDPRQITFLTNSYDPSSGRLLTQTLADQSFYQFAYTIDPGCTTNCRSSQTDITYPRTDATNPSTIVRRVAFNSDGYLTSDIRGLGSTEQETTTYARQTGTDFITDVTDTLNRITHYTYDGEGNEASVTQLYGTSNAVTTSFNYEPVFNRLSLMDDPLHHDTSFTYDDQANTVTVLDARGYQSVIALALTGQPASLTDPLQHQTTFAYDLGDLRSTTDPLGRTSTSFTDAGGRTAATVDPLSHLEAYAYDNLSDLTTQTDPLGGVTTWAYDKDGELLTLKDPNQNAGSLPGNTFAYYNTNELMTRTDPLNRVEAYVWDSDGNLTKVTDRNNQVTNFTYDHLDRLSFAGFGYNASNHTYASTITYGWDGGDRLHSAVDSAYGPVTRNYDGLDNLQSEATPLGSVSYTYDTASRRQTMTVAGQPQVTYGYNADNEVNSITQGSSVVSLAYDHADRQATTTLPNSVIETYAYDNPGTDVASITAKLGTTTLSALQYTYDGSALDDSVYGANARTNLPTAIGSATYDAANELKKWGTTSFAYDGNGNMRTAGTSTLTWDPRNQLSAYSGGSGSASFSYDPFGRRASKTIAGTTTQFLYDQTNPVQELSSGTPTANLITGLGTDQYYARTDSAGAAYLLTDRLGSIVDTTDSSGTVQTTYKYEPYGNTTTGGAASSNSFQFTGRENDGAATTLYYYRARYFAPKWGQFVSEDPQASAGEGANPYAYGMDNPTDMRDPSGEVATPSDPAHRGVNSSDNLATDVVAPSARWGKIPWCSYPPRGDCVALETSGAPALQSPASGRKDTQSGPNVPGNPQGGPGENPPWWVQVGQALTDCYIGGKVGAEFGAEIAPYLGEGAPAAPFVGGLIGCLSGAAGGYYTGVNPYSG